MKIELDVNAQKESIDILSLPFKADYKVLLFAGVADGSNLIPRFNFDQIVKNRRMVIKGIQIVPYYNYDENNSGIVEAHEKTSLDFTVYSGLNVNYRINRLFDRFEYSAEILFQINGSRIPIFQQVNDPNIDPSTWVGYPLDLQLDNIYYYYPASIKELSLSVEALVNHNINYNVENPPNVKVVVECYLF